MGRMPPPLPQERRTVYWLLRQAEQSWGNGPALHQPVGRGRYRTYSWAEYRAIAEEIGAGLSALGVGKQKKVGLASETRAEFYLADVGVMTNGSIAAAVYTSLPPFEQVRTLKACEPKAVFVENPKTLSELDAAGLADLAVPRILLDGTAEGAITLESLRDRGRAALAASPQLHNYFETGVQPEDAAILYLTSGATGEPKMGIVTHQAILANVDMGPAVLPLEEGDRTLAFLPSAHITQRLVLELLTLRMGVEVFFSEGLSRLPGELRSVRPTLFLAPPRVWERMYSSITTEIRKRPAWTRKLFYMGLGAGSEANRARQQGRAPSPWVNSSLRLFDVLVFSKIRERLGGRLRIAVSGAAPLAPDLAEFFAAIGLPLVEGYGLTEGGVVALNPVDRPVSGSIGKPLPGVEMKVADDGELLIRSETLFSGYFQDPEATAAVLRDGWLHTGDLATIDGQGFVRITGRKKELIVASNGKKIFPSQIEARFKLEPLINQVLLIGDRLPYITALITVNPHVADTLPGAASGADPATDEVVQREVKRIVAAVNRQLAPFEQIRKYRVLSRDFSMEHGEITPTMKLRRARVLENFRGEISELYAGRDDIG
jgi:long-chain acyl-CoA synthetase